MFTKRYWRIWLNILLIVWVHINCQHLKLYQHQTYFHVFSHTYDSWQLSHGGENESVAPHAASQSLAVGGRSSFKETLFFHILFRLTSSGSGKKNFLHEIVLECFLQFYTANNKIPPTAWKSLNMIFIALHPTYYNSVFSLCFRLTPQNSKHAG